jgi:hypothetical protein
VIEISERIYPVIVAVAVLFPVFGSLFIQLNVTEFVIAPHPLIPQFPMPVIIKLHVCPLDKVIHVTVNVLVPPLYTPALALTKVICEGSVSVIVIPVVVSGPLF